MIEYKIISTGCENRPWLTFVHGFTQNCNYFNLAIPQFIDNFNLLLIDLRGHGASSEIPGPYGCFEYTEDVIEVLDKEDIRRTYYWATHTGTGVGLAIALKRPELIESLILEGAVIPDIKMKRTNELITRAKNIAKNEGVQKAVDDWLQNADWYLYMQAHKEETNAKGQKELVSQFGGKPWLCELMPNPVPEVYPSLRFIRQPVLIYNGAYDLDEFKQIADTLEERLKCATRIVIPDSGGFPLWENPSEVIPVVKEYMEYNLRRF